ncbi:hypothetical protein BST22_05860 [Mycolicibacterium chubuense]|uniref:hypothetical protein n=1 Tax=Mycolicibacterium chubuense TaxID=1800 RepID=UPI0006549C48|nr:hypothetical protein [Mycolicibacterium chubuense]ORA54915.1 hypothetical protein BST22_05860 [Mycolicibacterium chubuense]
MTPRSWPFVGSEAIAQGLVRKHELRSSYQAVYPDVYAPAEVSLTLEHRAKAAWLWSHREGIIAGLTASALHGARWVDPALPIELVWSNARRPPGLITSDVRLRPDEYTSLHGLRLTTVARTAYDLARRGRLDDAVARLDALGNATGLRADDVMACARRHRGARGLRQLGTVLDLYDAGAASPKETWLRLLIIRAGHPRPHTQIPVVSLDGRRRYYLDMGWPGVMIAVEYDGEHHRTDDAQYARDIRRSEDLRDLGWLVIRVLKADRQSDIRARIERAWASRLRGDRGIS